MQFSIQQRVFLVKTYWCTKSLIETQRAFRRQFNVRNIPTRATILSMVRKLETTGSLLSETGKKRSVMSQECVNDVRERFVNSPKKSLRRLSQETGYSYGTCQRAAKKAGLRAYRVHVVHQLKEPDAEKRMRYCQWFQALLIATPDILSITWFTDEAWFHLSGYINTQNSRYWAAENPNIIHEAPLHPEKVGVWCAVSATRIVGPIFYDTKVNTAVYGRIFNTFVEQLDDIELTEGYFQQDGATCHTSGDSMKLIASFFGDRLVSKNLWPPRSPDLTSPDFFLWGYLKDRVYKNRPRSLAELREAIRNEISNINEDTLRKTSQNMVRRVQLCMDAGGGHFQHLL